MLHIRGEELSDTVLLSGKMEDLITWEILSQQLSIMAKEIPQRKGGGAHYSLTRII